MNSTKETSPGQDTIREIRQQPETWRDTVRRVSESGVVAPARPVLTGAGTSAYAGSAIEAAWPGSRAVASTELLLDFEEPLRNCDAVVSLARSGNSPESVGVVEKIRQALPGIRQIAITCNAEGKLANWAGVDAIILPPETNDRSLAMTSSLTNLILGGLCLARPDEVAEALPILCGSGAKMLSEYEEKARGIAQTPPERMVVLASAPLFGAAREACLKTLELTGGRIAILPETYLGLRHGPMSFVHRDTLVLCLISSDPRRRRYEMDLVNELRAKDIGRLLALAPADAPTEPFHDFVSTEASSLPDFLRAPVEIVFCQLLGYYFSRKFGLDPDNPSPGGVINRVVEGVTIYED